MKKRKTLQELTIKDNFLFGAVMVNEENCKEFLEMVLETRLRSVRKRASFTIRNIRASAWMFMPEMRSIHTTILRCRQRKSRL